MLSILPAADPLPLVDDGKGGLRVGKSRVPLETLIRAFDAGDSLDAVAAAYESLDRADVHALFAYYLRHPNEMKAYLGQRQEDEAATAQRIRELPTSQDGLRERLKSRKQA